MLRVITLDISSAYFLYRFCIWLPAAHLQSGFQPDEAAGQGIPKPDAMRFSSITSTFQQAEQAGIHTQRAPIAFLRKKSGDYIDFEEIK
jgi:hypothetical protein